MLKSLQKRYLRKRTNNNLENRDLSKLNDSVKTIGFLVDEDQFQDFDKLRDFSKDMGLQPKDVKIFTFMNVKKKLPTLRQNMVNNKHFTWKGEIHNKNAEEFLKIAFDVLVGDNQGKNEFMDWMMSKSKAKFKVGFSNTDDRIFDLVIKIKLLQVAKFKKEFLKYMKVLNKIK